jgi:rubrerythrin
MAAKKSAAKPTASKTKGDIKVVKGGATKKVEVKAKTTAAVPPKAKMASDKDVIAAGNAVSRSRRDESGLGQLDRDAVTAYNVDKNTAAGRAGTAAAKADAAKYFGDITVEKKSKAKGSKKILKERSDRNAKVATAISTASETANRPEASEMAARRLKGDTERVAQGKGAGGASISGSASDRTPESLKKSIFDRASTHDYREASLPCVTPGCNSKVEYSSDDSACPSCSASDQAKFDAFFAKSK